MDERKDRNQRTEKEGQKSHSFKRRFTQYPNLNFKELHGGIYSKLKPRHNRIKIPCLNRNPNPNKIGNLKLDIWKSGKVEILLEFGRLENLGN